MTNLINIDSHGTTMQTEVFHPAGTRNGGAIVVAHGSDGMAEPWADLIRGYATELAGQGFSAFIPSYFAKTGTVPGPSVFSQLPAKLPLWVEAVSDAVAHVKAVPGISAERVGLLGFSLGGHICLRLRGSTKVLVEFFAPELRQLGGLGAPQPRTPHVQIHHGLADLLVPFSETQAVVAALKHEGTAPEVFTYEGAGHGFAGADPNNATARRSSKGRTLAFFEKHLQLKKEARHAH
jgi:carboxymethylenebutenolidase